jgi:hypothetical protein
VIFLHPAMLFGLAAAAIPALLHLFERHPPPDADFPAIRYLREAERQSARRLKLQHLLLLLLRTALIVLVVLAAARPIVPTRARGAHEPTSLVVILDNSASAGAVVDGRPVLDRLRSVAQASFGAAGEGDRLWLVLADGVARRGSRTALAGAVARATVSPLRLDLTQAVEQAVRIVDAEPVTPREIHVVSDLQRTALGGGRVVVPGGVQVLALAPAVEPAPNRGIGPMQASDGAVSVPVVGTPGTGPGTVTVRLGARVVGRALAGPGAGVALPLPPVGPGWWVGEASVDPDELRADDRRLFVWHVASPARVAVAADAGPFVGAAVAVLRDAKRVLDGTDVSIGTHLGPGAAVVLPPADRALMGELNRALAARGVAWRYGAAGTPGPIAARDLGSIDGLSVVRRYQLVSGSGHGGVVMATVNGQPWLVRESGVVLLGSRLDTAWTALPAASGFISLVDALVNRMARGEAVVQAGEGTPRVQFATRGADTIGATVYGPDPRESDLTPAPRDLTERALGARALDEARFAATRFAGTHRADMSGLLLALALLVAALEVGVAALTR